MRTQLRVMYKETDKKINFLEERSFIQFQSYVVLSFCNQAFNFVNELVPKICKLLFKAVSCFSFDSKTFVRGNNV